MWDAFRDEYLPEERVGAYLEDIAPLAQRLGLQPSRTAGDLSSGDLLKTVQGPSPDPYWKLRPRGACQDVFFLTTGDRLADQIDRMARLAGETGYPASGLGVYLQPVVQGTGYHCEFHLFYDPGDARERECVRTLSSKATRVLLDRGAFFSRPYGETAGMVFNRDAASVAVLHKLKNIVDPNGIMNPGKICF